MKRTLNEAKESLYSSSMKNINKNLDSLIIAKREAAEARTKNQKQSKQN